MVFSSLHFLFLFLPAVLLSYYASPKWLRNGILLLFSLFFYAWGEPIYIVLMFLSIFIDFTHGMLVEKFRGTKISKIALISSIVMNLTLLGVFKYSDFIIYNLNQLLSLSIPLPNLTLPVGISFYTFQTMSYTIDVYRQDARVQRNIINFGTFVTLFPQLIAGPIVRYATVDKQLDGRQENSDQFAEGIRRFIIGLGKKVLLANNIGLLWSEISSWNGSRITILSAWFGIIAFAFQIYFDFSGYSDMAIGLGKLFGFDFLENFQYPYTAKSITQFWQTWHISLGTWFKEYVYIPLGGNRKGLVKQLRNIAIVWILTGIWHGASWNFMFWGIYYCILLILEKTILLKYLKRAPALLSRTYTLLLVLFGWVIFAFDKLSDGIQYLNYMFGFGSIPFSNANTIYLVTSNLVLMLLLILGSTPLPSKLGRTLRLHTQNKTLFFAILENVVLLSIFILAIAYLVDSTYNPFLYFRF